MTRRVPIVVLILLAAQVVAGGVGAYFYAWYTNSLEGSGRWVASKGHLERRVMGSGAFATSHQTLSRECLDLGRWFGFQEVLLAQPIAAREVAFDFRPAAGAYLVFMYGLGPEGIRGLRLSTSKGPPPGRMTIDAEGAFLDFQRVPELVVPADAWSHLELEFGSAEARAVLNGGSPLVIASPPAQQRFGFRSGLHSVLIDDVHVRCDGPGGFDESFFNARGFWRGLLALAAVLVLDVVVWRLVPRGRLVDRRTRGLALGGAVGLLAAAASAFWLRNAWAGRYPRADPDVENAWLDGEAAKVVDRIEEQHGRADPARTRVLVVGSSQTWGAGATRAEDGFVEVLERLLTAAEPARRWECINAGVQGLQADRLLQLFREHWLALEPDLLVVNLSNNDMDPGTFAGALEGFAELAAEHRIGVLFSLEANSTERRPEVPMHAIMRRVAVEHGIPVVDVHAALALQVERGFLWWDPVHPTSLGHRLIAETLLPALRALAGSS